MILLIESTLGQHWISIGEKAWKGCKALERVCRKHHAPRPLTAPPKGLSWIHNFGDFISVSVSLIGHSPIAVATPHTLINGFRHVNGESCRRRFFTSILYRTLIALSMYTNQNCQTQWLSHVIRGAFMSRTRFAYFRHFTSATLTRIFRPRTQFCNSNSAKFPSQRAKTAF